jgi:hypothetical protein
MSARIAYGPELAAAVADRLEQGETLANNHPYYCGVGLRFAEGIYVYDEVLDGHLPAVEQQASAYWAEPPNQRREFGTREEFVAWLASQSDESLRGADLNPAWLVDNQRITQARLEAFVRGEA